MILSKHPPTTTHWAGWRSNTKIRTNVLVSFEERCPMTIFLSFRAFLEFKYSKSYRIARIIDHWTGDQFLLSGPNELMKGTNKCDRRQHSICMRVCVRDAYVSMWGGPLIQPTKLENISNTEYRPRFNCNWIVIKNVSAFEENVHKYVVCLLLFISSRIFISINHKCNSNWGIIIIIIILIVLIQNCTRSCFSLKNIYCFSFAQRIVHN